MGFVSPPLGHFPEVGILVERDFASAGFPFLCSPSSPVASHLFHTFRKGSDRLQRTAWPLTWKWAP